MTPRSVSDLLAEQPEEALRAMRDAVARELNRLTLEAEQIDEALAKHARRSRSGGRRSDRITREQVLEVVRATNRAMTTAEVHDALVSQGLEASPNSIRNHLARLVDQNEALVRLPDGRFAPAPTRVPDFAPAAPQTANDDDIPF